MKSFQTAADHALETITTYQQIPYPAYSHRLTYPNAIATTAALFGVEPCPVERCRVLEIGCAAGANLIPMAYSLPGSQFVGVDISPDQVATGQKWIAELGLQNIRLVEKNLLDIGEDFGSFDYIIAHGVYSWVPPVVQEKLMAVCAGNLSANGVAWISYNTLPGWAERKILRDMILYRVKDVLDPHARVEKAVEFLDFISRESLSQTTERYKGYLNQIIAEIRKLDLTSDDRGYFYHEYLEGTSLPVYFQQFIDQAAQHGLQYLADAEVHGMTPYEFAPEVVNVISGFSASNIEFEQYLDFLRNRQFRQTLLCHQAVDLNRLQGAKRLANLSIRAHLKQAGRQINLLDGEAAVFITPSEDHITVSLPLQKAAFQYLAESYPQSVPFPALLQAALKRVGFSAASPEVQVYTEQVSSALVAAYLSAGVVEFNTWQPGCTYTVSEHPQASPVARLQARTQRRVTGLLHNMLNLDLAGRLVIQALDGSRDRSAIIAIVAQRLANSDFEYLPGEDRLSSDLAAYITQVDLNLETMLAAFAEKGLLVRELE